MVVVVGAAEEGDEVGVEVAAGEAVEEEDSRALIVK